MSNPSKDQLIEELKSLLAEAPSLHALDCNRNAHHGPCKCWLARRASLLNYGTTKGIRQYWRDQPQCTHNSVTVHLTGAACNLCGTELEFDGKSGNWIESRDDDSSIKSKTECDHEGAYVNGDYTKVVCLHCKAEMVWIQPEGYWEAKDAHSTKVSPARFIFERPTR